MIPSKQHPNGMRQCRGITTKKERCKIFVAESYCHHHRPGTPEKRQAHPKKSHQVVLAATKTRPPPQYIGIFEIQSPASVRNDRPGHIYIYTFLHLLTSGKHSDLGLYYLTGGSKSSPQSYVPNKLRFFFLKIGMTTQSVSSRLRQWKDQCKCDVTLISPQNDKFQNLKDKSVMGTLIRNFSLLSVSSEYRSYNPHQQAFRCLNNLPRAEQDIHKLLGERYGRVNFHCMGCSINGQHKSHMEWFCVPKSKLKKVYRIIDSCCLR